MEYDQWLMVAMGCGFLMFAGGAIGLLAVLRRRTCRQSATGAGGHAEELVYRFDFIDRIAITGVCRATIVCGRQENSCRIRNAASLAPALQIEHRNGRLEIAVPKNSSTRPDLEIFSTVMPSGLKLRRDAEIKISQAAGDQLNCKLSKGAKLTLTGGNIGSLNLKVVEKSSAQFELHTVGVCRLHVDGASRLNFAGNIKELEGHFTDESAADLQVVRNAEVEVSGGSKLDLIVTGKLSGDVVGASKLHYSGTTEAKVRKSNSSKINAG